MRTLLTFLVIVAVAYLALLAFVYVTQRGQIYFPTAESRHPHAQALWIDRGGERIKVWVVPRPGSQALLYFGGNAEDVAGNIDLFAEAFPDRSLYLVNYRGYGGSSGRPTEAGLQADALAVFDHVRQERDSLVNVAREYFRWLPVGLLLRDRYESATRANEVEAPVLIVIAGDDEIVSRARSEALAAAFKPGQVQVEVIPGVGHNTLDESPAYLEAVRRFLAINGEASASTGSSRARSWF